MTQREKTISQVGWRAVYILIFNIMKLSFWLIFFSEGQKSLL